MRRVAAEIVLGLEGLHGQGVAFRDLKLENVLLGADGHVKIGDFGLATRLEDGGNGRWAKMRSVCGTRNYLCPEMVNGEGYGLGVDLWCLGVLLFRMVAGKFPFEGRTREVFAGIRKGRVSMPGWVGFECGDLICGLLVGEGERLGIEDVKRHEFFAGVVWEEVFKGRMGKAVEDLEIGDGGLGAMRNFELGRVAEVSLGEEGDACEDMVGFEYGIGERRGLVKPIDVIRKSSGMLSKIASIDSIISAGSGR